jgi:hypothetical protein
MVRAYDIEFYCKISEVISDYGTSYTFSFGGANDYCFIASMKSPKNIPYIDRIEYGEKCIKDGVLSSGGTVKLVKAALWTMKHLFKHHITRFELQDESYIYCMKGSKRFKLRLGYDMIIKYNKTWYEHHFGAELPINTYNTYKSMIKILDSESIPYEAAVKSYPYIKKYEEEWRSTSSPREFIEAIRKKYGTEQYCYEVGGWLDGFFEDLGISIYNREWFIDAKNVIQPPGYEIFLSTTEMKGAGKKKKFNKTAKRSKYVIKSEKPKYCIGWIDSYDENDTHK